MAAVKGKPGFKSLHETPCNVTEVSLGGRLLTHAPLSNTNSFS